MLLMVSLVVLLVPLVIAAPVAIFIGDVCHRSSPMAALSNLDFKLGLEFQDLVYDRFDPFAHVYSLSSSDDFSGSIPSISH